jgi:hypothetical protein
MALILAQRRWHRGCSNVSAGDDAMRWLIAATLLVLIPAVAQAQDARRPVPERSAEPNYGTKPDPATGTGPGGVEIRPGSPDGDTPSASAGRIAKDPVAQRRILGLPVTTALVIAAVILGIVAAAGLVVPSARRRARARGNGTYGGDR